MSSISYDFILVVVIFELVFAFSIGIVCVLFSCSLYRAIKDSESVEDFQDINLSDHNSHNSSHYTDEDFDSVTDSILQHFEANHYGSLSYSVSSSNTINDIVSPARVSNHHQITYQSPHSKKEKSTLSATSSPFKSLLFPDDPSYTHVTQDDSTKVDEYIIDEKLSELDLERRLDTGSPFTLTTTPNNNDLSLSPNGSLLDSFMPVLRLLTEP